MARMIPRHIHRNTPSGERLLFELFRDDLAMADWTVLHSLYLSQHGYRPYGEVDFVVFIPQQGIFCLEVKSGAIDQHDGVWSTVGREGVSITLKRSPFAQSRDTMFAVRERLLREPVAGVDLRQLTFGNAVVFPHTYFQHLSEEWEPWEVIDRTSLEQSLTVALMRLAREQRRRMNTPPELQEPSKGTVRALVQVLRPDFETVLARGATIAESERALCRLTEEQFDFLFNLPDHPRWVCEGAAGTGKTMLALEFARRLTDTTDERVLFLCFNRLLGCWLDTEINSRGLSNRVKAGSFHQLLREVILKSSKAGEFTAAERRGGPELFNQIYPDLGWQAVEELGEKFDAIIVDEAQDLVQPSVMDVFDAWLKGGLAGSRAVFFGDYHRQGIYSSLSGSEQKALLEKCLPGRAPTILRRNCRNTRVIAEETALLSGFEQLPYRLGSEAGVPVDYARYRDDAHQAVLLGEKITKLLADGVHPENVVILSPRKMANSAVRLLDDCALFRIIEVGAAPLHSRKPVIRFATAQAFKGMESSVVVLCDVDTLGDGDPQSLLYVAMSRARCQLTVLRHEATQPAYIACLKRSLTANWQQK